MRLSAESPPRAVVFEVLADTDPCVLPRVLNTLARRDLVPDQVKAVRRGATQEVRVAFDALPPEMLHVIEGNLRQIIGMRRVTVELGRCLAQAA